MSETEPTNRVTVVDIKIPFGTLAAFFLKASIAAIPAAIVLGLISALLSVFLIWLPALLY